MQREEQQCRDYANEGTTFSECIAISAMNYTGCKVCFIMFFADFVAALYFGKYFLNDSINMFQLRWEYHAEAKKNFPDCDNTASINQQIMFRMQIMGKSLEDVTK